MYYDQSTSFNKANTRLSVVIFCIIPAILLLTLLWHPAQAATINVGCTNGIGDAAGLISAIEEANADPNSLDSIELGQNCEYTISLPYDNQKNALPPINGKLNFVGNSAKIQRARGAVDMRLLRIKAGSTVSIAGLNFSFGKTSTSDGGAILAEVDTTLNLNSVSLTDNEALLGGAVRFDGTQLTISNSRFVGNKAIEEGGAIYTFRAGTVSIQGSHFDGNVSNDDKGGAISNAKTLSIIDTDFIDNQVLVLNPATDANAYGGAIYTTGATVVRNGSFQENEASAPSGRGHGGAIYAVERLELNGTTFTGNSTNFAGGAVYAQNFLTGRDVTFTNNGEEPPETILRGGALYSERNVFLTAPNFTGNSAAFGGAFVQKESSQAVFLQGSTFQSNRASDSGALSSDGPLTVIQGEFFDNRGVDRCGALKSIGDAVIRNSTFMRNVAENEHGGAACFEGGTILISESQFLFNKAVPASPQDTTLGGAIFIRNNNAKRLDITSSTFQGNEASLYGGAITSLADQTNIADAVFAHNKAQPAADTTDARPSQGGALHLGPASIRTSHFENNQAQQGGAMYTRNDILIERNKFIENRADSGGALYTDRTTPDGEGPDIIQNNLWIGNQTPEFGTAVYIRRYKDGLQAITMRHETIVNPTDSPAAENAISVLEADLELTNSIISNFGTGVRVEFGGSTLRSSHNIYFGNGMDIDDEVEQVNDLNVDPRFVNPNAEDYSLKPDSPAINSGIETDADDDYDGNDRPHGAGVDRGAFEYQGDVPAPTATPVQPTPTSTAIPPTPGPTATATVVPPNEQPTEQPTEAPTEAPTVDPTTTAQPTATTTPPTVEPTQVPPTAVPSTPVPPTPDPTAEPEAPIAGLSAENSGPALAGNAINFFASVASGSGVEYSWDFGDGENGSGATPSHAYASPGTYTARVTARNGVSEASAETTVTVQEPPAEAEPIDNLAASVNGEMMVSRSLTFVATISSGSGVAYSWDFGDGTNATGPVASHTYAEPGTYLVRVVAENGASNSEVETTVTITESANSPAVGVGDLAPRVFLPFIH